MKILAFGPQGMTERPTADLGGLLAAAEGMIWVDMLGPSDEDVLAMHDAFHFHPLTVEDTRNHRQRPKVEEYADYLFVILNAITARISDLEFRELDIFVGKNYVVTVHTGNEAVIEEIRSRIERAKLATTLFPGYLLYLLLDSVVDSYFPILDVIEEEIDRLGDLILTNPQPSSLNRLFELKSQLIDMWRVVWPQRDILNNITHHPLAFVNQDFLQPYLRDVNDHLMWVADMVNTFRDTLTSVIDLYMSAVSNRLNVVVNRLTIFTVMIGLLGVIAGFYGMNFIHTWPPFDSVWGVPFVLALMASIAGALLYLLRRFKWF